jgi:hypothetical protein
MTVLSDIVADCVHTKDAVLAQEKASKRNILMSHSSYVEAKN